MSSSNRRSVALTGTVSRQSQPIGPMRLPVKSRESFVEQFNVLYGRIGLTLSKQDHPASPPTEADDDSL